MPKFMVEDGSNISRKLVELRDLAIYWDPKSVMIGDLPRHEFNVCLSLACLLLFSLGNVIPVRVTMLYPAFNICIS